MSQNKQQVKSQITFLYYRDLAPISAFYENIIGLELVQDYGWAKVYRVNGNAYLAIVDEKEGFYDAQEKNAVLFGLIVDDVPWWYEYLTSKGVKILTELSQSERIQVQAFKCQDPGGYAIEIERFLNPEIARIFHGSD